MCRVETPGVAVPEQREATKPRSAEVRLQVRPYGVGVGQRRGFFAKPFARALGHPVAVLQRVVARDMCVEQEDRGHDAAFRPLRSPTTSTAAACRFWR
jgi:hypothetical protein